MFHGNKDGLVRTRQQTYSSFKSEALEVVIFDTPLGYMESHYDVMLRPFNGHHEQEYF